MLNKLLQNILIAIISLGILTYTTMIGSVLADDESPSAKFNQPEAKDKQN